MEQEVLGLGAPTPGPLLHRTLHSFVAPPAKHPHVAFWVVATTTWQVSPLQPVSWQQAASYQYHLEVIFSKPHEHQQQWKSEIHDHSHMQQLDSCPEGP